MQEQHRLAVGAGPRFPVAEDAYARALSLPLFPRMSEQDVRDVCEAVRRAVRARIEEIWGKRPITKVLVTTLSGRA